MSELKSSERLQKKVQAGRGAGECERERFRRTKLVDGLIGRGRLVRAHFPERAENAAALSDGGLGVNPVDRQHYRARIGIDEDLADRPIAQDEHAIDKAVTIQEGQEAERHIATDVRAGAGVVSSAPRSPARK